MNILASLKSNFQTTFPRLASGNYVHFFVVRHSQSFPIFQTDGVLNTARTQAGLDSTHEMSRQFISRLVMFKRKQVTPERLTGRELLRSLNLTSGQRKGASRRRVSEILNLPQFTLGKLVPTLLWVFCAR